MLGVLQSEMYYVPPLLSLFYAGFDSVLRDWISVPSVCVCLMAVGLNGTAVHLQASLPKLHLITTCSL